MIMDIHMDYSNSGKSFVALRILHGAIRRFFLDWARPHLDRIYPVVPVSFPFMREIYGVPDSEMELLPLGADMDLIEETQARCDRDALRAELGIGPRSAEHTSELQSLMRTSYADFCLQKQ